MTRATSWASGLWPSPPGLCSWPRLQEDPEDPEGPTQGPLTLDSPLSQLSLQSPEPTHISQGRIPRPWGPDCPRECHAQWSQRASKQGKSSQRAHKDRVPNAKATSSEKPSRASPKSPLSPAMLPWYLGKGPKATPQPLCPCTSPRPF